MWCNGNTPALGAGIAVRVRHLLPFETLTATFQKQQFCFQIVILMRLVDIGP